MKKIAGGLIIVSGIWALMQIQSVNNAVYMFVVLNINPFTNRPVSVAVVYSLMVVIAVSSAFVIFNKELNFLIDNILEWVVIPRKSKINKTASLIKENLNNLSYPNKVNIHQDFLDNSIAAEPVAALPVLVDTSVLNLTEPAKKKRKPVKAQIKLPDFKNAGVGIFKTLKVAVIMAAMGLAVVEFYLMNIAKKIISTIVAAYISTASIVYNLLSDIIQWTLAAAGFVLTTFMLFGFIIMKLAEPAVRKIDHRIAKALHNSESAESLLKFAHEMFMTFVLWKYELKSLRKSLYR